MGLRPDLKQKAEELLKLLGRESQWGAPSPMALGDRIVSDVHDLKMMGYSDEQICSVSQGGGTVEELLKHTLDTRARLDLDPEGLGRT